MSDTTGGPKQREAVLRDLGRIFQVLNVPMQEAVSAAGEAWRRVHEDGEDERAVVADIVDRIATTN